MTSPNDPARPTTSPPLSASPAPPDGDEGLEVMALLLCREVQNGRSGVTLREIIELVPVLAFPGEAGPLTFCAIVRPHRPGEAEVVFRVHPLGHPETTLVRMPGRLRVERGYEGRQTIVSAGFRSMTVNGGGWFGVEFLLGDRVVARTRFAIGAMGGAPASAAPATP